MSRYEHVSALAGDIDAYLAFKASAGIWCQSRDWHMHDFDRWCEAVGATELDRATVEGWVKQRKDKTSPDHLSWMSYVRDFGRWMRANGHPDAYVLSRDFRAKPSRASCCLLSQAEIDAFFQAASEFRPRSPWAWQAVPFFGLMHSCGLRTCEVRRLAPSDVDVDGRVIDVMWSKGNRSRRLAVSDEVAAMLASCEAETAARFGAARQSFFTTAAGNPVGAAGVGVAFRRIWEAAGLPPEKNGRRPRPYDLRHRFAYANVERWRSAGTDVEAMLPYLSRYMGHTNFESTYYYVHTSPDFLSEYADIIRPLEGVLPEVGYDG